MYFYCDLVADKKWRIIRKKKSTSFYPLHHQLSNNLFGLQTIGENQISVVSLSFWTKTWTVIIHPRPKTATPVFSPSRKIKSKYKKKIFLRLWSISVNFCFCLSYSLVFQNNPQPPFLWVFQLIISRSLSYPLLSRLKNGGSVLIKPISDNTLFSNRSPIMGVADFIWLPCPSAQPHSR